MKTYLIKYEYKNLGELSNAKQAICFINVDPLQFKYPELTPFQPSN